MHWLLAPIAAPAQVGEGVGEIIGVGRGDLQLKSAGVAKAELIGVQGLTIDDGGLAGASPAINMIAEDGGVGFIKVHADLVGATGLQAAGHEASAAVKALQDAVVSDGSTLAAMVARKAHALAGVTVVRGVKGTTGGKSRPVNQGVVDAMDGVVSKVVAQALMGPVLAGDDQGTRGVAVKSVDDARSQVSCLG